MAKFLTKTSLLLDFIKYLEIANNKTLTPKMRQLLVRCTDESTYPKGEEISGKDGYQLISFLIDELSLLESMKSGFVHFSKIPDNAPNIVAEVLESIEKHPVYYSYVPTLLDLIAIHDLGCDFCHLSEDDKVDVEKTSEFFGTHADAALVELLSQVEIEVLE